METKPLFCGPKNHFSSKLTEDCKKMCKGSEINRWWINVTKIVIQCAKFQHYHSWKVQSVFIPKHNFHYIARFL